MIDLLPKPLQNSKLGIENERFGRQPTEPPRESSTCASHLLMG